MEESKRLSSQNKGLKIPKGVTRSRNSKDRQHNGQNKGLKIPKQGRIQDFKLGGALRKKSHRAEGGAKFFGVFRVKNRDFTQKNHILSNFRGRAPGALPPPPWICPCKGVIRSRNSKDRQHNGQKKWDNRTNNYLQNTTQRKSKDRVTRTPLKAGVNSGAPEGWGIPDPHVIPVVLTTIVINPVISHEWGKNRIVKTSGNISLSNPRLLKIICRMDLLFIYIDGKMKILHK